SRDDLTSRSYAIFGFPLALCARRASSIASRLPGTNRLGFQPSLAVSVWSMTLLPPSQSLKS
ncbi:MAG: hypothetical protein RPU61_00005, partial [Candidatus Sedimenticola sp. (ex Thyasira tokunagai)]